MNNAAQLIESYARRLAQTPHTGDEGQDTETYKIVLRAMLEDAEKHVYARALLRDRVVHREASAEEDARILEHLKTALYQFDKGFGYETRAQAFLAAFRDCTQ